MKLGIITIHNSPNYGACLQSYGLYQYLCSEGYDCEVIDLHRPTHDDYVESKKYVVSRKVKTRNPFKIFLNKLRGTKTKKKVMATEAKERFDKFNGKIRLSSSYTGIDSLYDNPPEYDVYISGSDQLWNPTIGFCNEPYFLTFVRNSGKRISYATSIGINNLFEAEKKNYALWLQAYSHISVREISAQQLLKSFIDKPVTQVADPSFLPDRQHWHTLAKRPVLNNPYIMLFTLNFSEDLLNMAKRLSVESGKTLAYVCLNQPESDGAYISEKNAGPEEWLGYLANADMVITDSFHGTVFSIIMGVRNFFSYVPSTQKRGTRITDLLDTFHLRDHYFDESGLKESYNTLVGKCINQGNITSIYMAEQERSRAFLNNAIHC